MKKVLKHYLKGCLLLLLLLFSNQILIADVIWQNEKKIAVKSEQMTLKQAVMEVEKTFGCNFLYNNNLIDDSQLVSLNTRNKTLSSVLEYMLTNKKISFKLIENQIILYPEGMYDDASTIQNRERAEKIVNNSQNKNQNRRVITGLIISSDDKMPLAGVTVIPDNTPSKGVSADINGKYAIEIGDSVKTLNFSYIGYETQQVEIGGKGVINIELTPDAIALNEVVVSTGYVNEKKKNLSGAVSNVSGKELHMANVSNIQRALEGKAAGVQIVSANGLPGASVNINIRGKSSINGGITPLYIVDGVQMTTGDFAKIVQTSNVLSALNPEDIESVDILKDAATASIYGAQAANGVIIIKTKRGETGKPKINFSMNYGLDMVSDNVEICNSEQFIELNLMGIYNRYGNSNSNFTTPFNTYKSRGWILSEAADFPNIVFDSGKVPNDNWKKSIFRTGVTREYQLGVSAGNEHVKSYVSGSYNDSDASTIYNYFQRLTVRSNIDVKVNKWLDINNSTTFGSTKQRQPTTGGLIATPVRGVLMMIPYNRIYNEDGTLNVNNLEGAQTTNPVQASELNVYKLTTNKLTHSTDFVFHLLQNLEFKASGKIDYNTLYEHQFLDPLTPQGMAYNGFIATANTQIVNIQTSETLNYKYISSDSRHRMNVLAGFEYKDYSSRSNETSAVGVPSSDFQLLSQAGTIDSFTESFTGYKLIGLFGRIGYTYDDKYILNLVVRRDGSSRFGENRKWGTFPSFSAAWRISNENFLKNNKLINDLKLKFSYGLTGNSDIGNFVARPQFAGSGRYDNISGISPSIPGNKDLTWETKYSLNFGIDFSMFANRITIQTDYFNDITRNLLFDRPVPINSGYTTIPQNVGSVRNQGIELSINLVPVRNDKFQWSITPNYTWLNNKILSLINGASQIGNTLVVGKPIDVFYTYNFAGVNPADGRPMWYNKDGYIVYKQNSEDRVYLNGIYPTFYGGVVNSFSWKNFDFSFLFQFQSGARRANSDKVQLSRVGNTNDRNQLLKMYTDFWKEPGQITSVAQPMTGNTYLGPGGSTTSYSATSSYHYEKTDFIKLKNISVSYVFPKKICSRLGVNGLTMALNAFNLWTTTPYTGYDPEFTGSDSGTYPQSRTITYVLKLDL